MSEKLKILKIKVGEVFIGGKSYPVWTTAWRKESKKGGVYYEVRQPLFPQEIEKKPSITEETL